MSDDREDGVLREVRETVMSKTYDAIISGAGIIGACVIR